MCLLLHFKLCDRANRAMVRCEVTESSPVHNRMHKNFPRQKHGIGVVSKALCVFFPTCLSEYRRNPS